MCIIISCTIPWYNKIKEIPITGMPFFFAILASVWNSRLLPLSVFTYGTPNVLHIVLLVIFVDLVQCILHFSLHKKILGLYAYNAHNIHHKVKNPKPRDAFSTGLLDSVTQLIMPIFVSIYWIEPNRTTVILFGILYSQWLLYIHSDLAQISKYLVSPQYHKQHHQNLEVNFAHVFPLWDTLLKTCSTKF